MLVVEMLVALILALVVASVLAALRPRPGATGASVFVFFFFMACPLIWAAGVWLTPIGPSPGGVSWLGFVLVTMFLLLLILAVAPTAGSRRISPQRLRDPQARKQMQRETIAGTTVFFGICFWLLLIAAATALVARYGAP